MDRKRLLLEFARRDDFFAERPATAAFCHRDELTRAFELIEPEVSHIPAFYTSDRALGG